MSLVGGMRPKIKRTRTFLAQLFSVHLSPTPTQLFLHKTHKQMNKTLSACQRAPLPQTPREGQGDKRTGVTSPYHHTHISLGL